MKYKARRVDYFYTRVKDRPGQAYQLLSHLANSEVNLLAFSVVPMGPDVAQLTLFPNNVEHMVQAAENAGLILEGPYPALLVQGDDRLGALAEIHAKLYDARVNVFSATAVTDGKGCYGYVIYLHPDEIDLATNAVT
jgi:hypothetical protein